jgi:hypothetical protein
MMKFLGFCLIVFLTYTVGLDHVLGALDSLDETVRASYAHARALHPARSHIEPLRTHERSRPGAR